jgi:hypothetical protein
MRYNQRTIGLAVYLAMQIFSGCINTPAEWAAYNTAHPQPPSPPMTPGLDLTHFDCASTDLVCLSVQSAETVAAKNKPAQCLSAPIPGLCFETLAFSSPTLTLCDSIPIASGDNSLAIKQHCYIEVAVRTRQPTICDQYPCGTAGTRPDCASECYAITYSAIDDCVHATFGGTTLHPLCGPVNLAAETLWHNATNRRCDHGIEYPAELIPQNDYQQDYEIDCSTGADIGGTLVRDDKGSWKLTGSISIKHRTSRDKN